VPLNPLISEPLFWAHYIERAGTGTLDMIVLCRKAGIPEPEFEQRGAQFVLTIRRKKRVPSESATQSPTQSAGPVDGQVEAHDEAHDGPMSELEHRILSACQDAAKTTQELLRVLGYTT
jgi:predicted HTH transcriptional regulator